MLITLCGWSYMLTNMGSPSIMLAAIGQIIFFPQGESCGVLDL